MTTIHEAPHLAPEDDDKHKQEILAHLFDMWAFEHIDTTVLTVEEVVEDSQVAHNDLHRDEE